MAHGRRQQRGAPRRESGAGSKAVRQRGAAWSSAAADRSIVGRRDLITGESLTDAQPGFGRPEPGAGRVHLNDRRWRRRGIGAATSRARQHRQADGESCCSKGKARGEPTAPVIRGELRQPLPDLGPHGAPPRPATPRCCCAPARLRSADGDHRGAHSISPSLGAEEHRQGLPERDLRLLPLIALFMLRCTTCCSAWSRRSAARRQPAASDRRPVDARWRGDARRSPASPRSR